MILAKRLDQFGGLVGHLTEHDTRGVLEDGLQCLEISIANLLECLDEQGVLQ